MLSTHPEVVKVVGLVSYSILKESKIVSRQFKAQQPSWAKTLLTMNKINDYSSIVNIGRGKKRQAMHLDMMANQLTAWDQYPKRYKFFSVDFHAS